MKERLCDFLRGGEGGGQTKAKSQASCVEGEMLLRPGSVLFP